ncbi:hypothetical protein [Xanthomonas translucens]|uniref:hypothetical protein n=1 Tax=Xanthomonas campestris pv. translucens TaxID=343 RepID=UPI0019D6D338|nr:hypothetical protein [Xanthomonas translucens]QSQ34124.1 hypothetical protein ISN31_00005 [Xanthomonas translucens pv. translucens]
MRSSALSHLDRLEARFSAEIQMNMGACGKVEEHGATIIERQLDVRLSGLLLHCVTYCGRLASSDSVRRRRRCADLGTGRAVPLRCGSQGDLVWRRA